MACTCVRTVSIIDHIAAGVMLLKLFLITLNDRGERSRRFLLHEERTRRLLRIPDGTIGNFGKGGGIRQKRKQTIIECSWTNRPERITLRSDVLLVYLKRRVNVHIGNCAYKRL